MSVRDLTQPQQIRVRKSGPWSGTVITASEISGGQRTGHDRHVGDVIIVEGGEAVKMVQLGIAEYVDGAATPEDE